MKASGPVRSCIIANPVAGSGRAARAAQELRDALGDCDLRLTESVGHAAHLAREAAKAGALEVVAVGGDGTIQEVVSGLCLDESGKAQRCETALAILPAGTGGDYRRTHDLSSSIPETVTRVRCGQRTPVDIGRVVLGQAEETETLAFANVLSFGIGGLTDRLVERSPKWLGGKAVFFLGAARATLAYSPVAVELEFDDGQRLIAPISNVAVCIGRYFGGGMKIAPDADPADGLFDVVVVEGSKLETLALSADIYRGTHLKRRTVTHRRSRTLRARATGVGGEVLVDADGNQPGTLPLEAECIHHALDLLL